MRIFVGIDLDPAIRTRIERFLEGVEAFAPDARWVRPKSLHITLKFIGEQKPEQVDVIRERLLRVEAPSIELRVAGYGFFPTARTPRVFWIGIQAGAKLSQLAERVDMATADVGIPREDRPYNPHLTLARSGAARSSGSPKWRKGDASNSIFAVLDKRLATMGDLDFGTMTAREFILYQSQLSAGGSKYTKLHRFPLRPPDQSQISGAK
jgi:RNA 2',3'-cyclic 3'-phosphodiesterase